MDASSTTREPYDEYVWSLQNGALKDRSPSTEAVPVAVVGPATASPPTPPVAPKVNFKESSKHFQAQIREEERAIAKAEARLDKLSKQRDSLNEKLLSATGADAQHTAKELGYCAMEIEKIENELIEHMEILEGHQKNLDRLRN